MAMQSGRQLSSLGYTTHKLKLSWLLYVTKYSQVIENVNMELVPNVSETFYMSISKYQCQPLMMEPETVPKMQNTNSTATWLITWEDFVTSLD